ncbi:hypothetical protein ACIA03_16550 [Nocardioides sp. NPDC051685]|uniref:hypothetical protein n=1 Tax=Nocardioides sp. NPDC051685 TaxID=3364334 RepID=UPI003788AC7C
MTTSVNDRTSASAPMRAGGTGALDSGGGWANIAVVLAALMAMAAWLPFLHRPLTPDESGFLLIAQQWRPGHSLYGDYWVDRPPLLIWLFTLADHLGAVHLTAAGAATAPVLKLIGAVASGTSVALSGVLAGLVSPSHRSVRIMTVLVAAALLSSPLLGMPGVNGELLALPFVLLGLVCAVAAMRGSWGWRTAALAAGVGACGMAAALMKQNVIDVFVFTLVLLAVSHRQVPRWRGRAAAVVVGAALPLSTVILTAWAQGTSAPGLWDAVVVFRTHASEMIDASASSATAVRGALLVAAFLGSGAAVMLVTAVAAILARRTPLAWPALAMTGWEVFAIAMGGSYWLHYLTGIVPGLVLLVAIVRPGHGSRLALRWAVAYTVAAALAVWTFHVVIPPQVTPEDQVSSYLREHAGPADGVVVGFGHPEIVAASGLHSPYEHLWSLPVRVRDPHLAGLRDVLAGASAPRWIVVDGDSLDTWGLDAGNVEQYLLRHYEERVSFDSWHIWQRRGLEGTRR